MKYKTMNGWTKERMIKQIMERNNGTRAVVNDEEGPPVCLYETEDGNHCAVGCFIPSGHPAMEFKDSVCFLLEAHQDLKSVLPLDLSGLKQFQQAHDLHDVRVMYGCDPRPDLIRWINENVEDNDVLA